MVPYYTKCSVTGRMRKNMMIHHLENFFEISLIGMPSKTCDINFTVIRIAITSVLLSFWVRDENIESKIRL